MSVDLVMTGNRKHAQETHASMVPRDFLYLINPSAFGDIKMAGSRENNDAFEDVIN